MEGGRSEVSKKGQKKPVPINPANLLGFHMPEVKEETDRAFKRYIPSLTKEEYVHANFKFVVNPAADYISLITDPEKQLNWDTVELVTLLLRFRLFAL